MLVDRDIESDYVDTPEEDDSISNELAKLTKYVDMITSMVQGVESPVTTTSKQLPQATVHLNDLTKLTEEGTHRVLALTQAIETNRDAMQAALEQLQQQVGSEHTADVERVVDMVKADERRLTDIHVALSFQDLVAQRVPKLAAILNEVQHKLLKLVVVFGIKYKKDGATAKDDGRGSEMLRQLEAS